MSEEYNQMQCRVARQIAHMMAEFDISIIDLHPGQYNLYFETTSGRKVMVEKQKDREDMVDPSELGCPPGCTNPICNCPGTD